ncbi:hypothetical protein NL676_018366 [Syzygium grande]|nr:hypothetical protein NL676_018366 [Syzygium grande]
MIAWGCSVLVGGGAGKKEMKMRKKEWQCFFESSKRGSVLKFIGVVVSLRVLSFSDCVREKEGNGKEEQWPGEGDMFRCGRI